MKESDLLIYKLLLLFQLVYLSTFLLLIWTSLFMKILFYLSFVIVFFSCIYSFIFVYISFDLKFNYSHKPKLFKFTCKIFQILNITIKVIVICSKSLHFFNNLYLGKYLKNCPFTLSSDLVSKNTPYYAKRRCELYNINTNSRYKYQYICSYNASKDFDNDKSDKGLAQIICIPKKNNISHNNIFNQFNALYGNYDSELFYCNRFDLPIKNTYIKDEYCSNKKDFMNNLFETLYFIINILFIFFGELFIEIQEDLEARYRNEILNQARRLLGDINDNCSTDNDESNSNNISFDNENDENIIVENNEVSNLDLSIRDYVENGEKPKLD